MRPLFAILRFVVALAIVAAIIGQLQTSLGYWHDTAGIADPTVQLVNFFSFFTIESNVLSVVVLGIGAFLPPAPQRR